MAARFATYDRFCDITNPNMENMSVLSAQRMYALKINLMS